MSWPITYLDEIAHEVDSATSTIPIFVDHLQENLVLVRFADMKNTFGRRICFDVLTHISKDLA